MPYLTRMVLMAFLVGLSAPSYGGDRDDEDPEDTSVTRFFFIPSRSLSASTSDSTSASDLESGSSSEDVRAASPDPSPSSTPLSRSSSASSLEGSEDSEEDGADSLVWGFAQSFKMEKLLLEQDQNMHRLSEKLGAVVLFPAKELEEKRTKTLEGYKAMALLVFNQFGLLNVRKMTFDKLWTEWTKDSLDSLDSQDSRESQDSYEEL